MKKIYTFLLIILVSTMTVLGQDPYYVSNSSGLNLRKGPGSNYETVSSIPHGTKVTVVSQENSEWWKVKYNGQEGYVSAKYLSKDQPKNTDSNKNNNPNNNNSNSNNNSRSSANNNNNNNNNNSSRNNSSGSSANRNNNSNSSGSNNYNYGIGLRLGDPSGITGIKYLGNSRGLEVSIGRTSVWSHGFQRRFDKYEDFDGYLYHSARFKSAIGVQVHYLFFKDIGSGGFQWYYGFGGQLKALTIDYDYSYKHYYGPGQGDYRWVRAKERVTDLDLGVDGVIGINYNFKEIPMTVFADVTLFGEIYDNPFLFWFQSGVGLRYNF